MRAIFHLTLGSALTLSLASDGNHVAEATAVEPIVNGWQSTEMDLPFLDAASLQTHEASIISSLRQNNPFHRSLLTNTCMFDVYKSRGGSGNSLGCTAQDVKFLAITGVDVSDPGAERDANGIWQNACRGNDDYVNLSFTANIEVGASRYDIGMYINTEGGSAMTGTCAMSLMSDVDYSVNPATVKDVGGGEFVTIDEIETGTAADQCPDMSATKTGVILYDYPFAEVSFIRPVMV
jgi:hypothetical protein